MPGKLMTGGKKKNINEALIDGQARKDPKEQTTLMLRKSVRRKLKVLAFQQDKTMSDLVDEALESFFANGEQ